MTTHRFYADTWEVCASTCSESARSLTRVRYFWQTCFISFTGSVDFPSAPCWIVFVACCSYIHCLNCGSEKAPRTTRRQDSGGRLVVSRGNCTRRRCTELLASRSSSRPVDRRGSPVRRVNITQDTPRWMVTAGRPTPRGSDKGRPSLDRLDDPRKVGLRRRCFINNRARLFMRKHKHGQLVRIGVAKKPVHTHFRKHSTV